MYLTRILEPSMGASSIVLDADAEQTVSIPLEDDVVGIALQGFRINTDVEQSADYPVDYNPAHGYTSAGISCAIAPDFDQQTANISVQVDWGPQDRSVMNEAMLHAKSEVTVYWAQIKNKTEPTTQNFSESRNPYRMNPLFREHDIPVQEIEHESNSVVGIRSFSLKLADQDGSDMGSYWRNMGVEITPILREAAFLCMLPTHHLSKRSQSISRVPSHLIYTRWHTKILR